MSDDTIRVSRGAADSLCNSWHTLADAYSNENPVRVAILRCVDELEALIAAMPQEPKRVSEAPYCRDCGHPESYHTFTCVGYPFEGQCDCMTTPQEPKRRFTDAERKLFEHFCRYSPDARDRAMFHALAAEAEASESGEQHGS